jgi:hypothetical protein
MQRIEYSSSNVSFEYSFSVPDTTSTIVAELCRSGYGAGSWRSLMLNKLKVIRSGADGEPSHARRPPEINRVALAIRKHEHGV